MAGVPNFGKSGDGQSKRGIMEKLKLTLTLLAALEFKLDIVQAINESYLIIVDSFHLRF